LDQVAWLGFGLFCVASFVAGLRLLLLWSRTRLLPELSAGMALLCIGPLGFSLTVLSTSIPSPALANSVWAVAGLSLNLGAASAFLFTQVVYYPEKAAVRRAVALLALVLAGCWVFEGLTHGFIAQESAGPAIRISDWLRTFALIWASAEALRFHHKLRRRLALGLADPEVTRRFLLWGIGIGSAGLGSLIDSTVKLLVERAWEVPALTLSNALTGTVAAIGLWMAFVPRSRRAAVQPKPA
jgi:hypothetical protein